MKRNPVIILAVFLILLITTPAWASQPSTEGANKSISSSVVDLAGVLKTLQGEKPEVVSAIGNLRSVVLQNSVLDQKTNALVGVGIAVALKDQNAIYGHIIIAKQAGATEDEVISTILLAIPSCGAPAALDALPLAWDIYK